MLEDNNDRQIPNAPATDNEKNPSERHPHIGQPNRHRPAPDSRERLRRRRKRKERRLILLAIAVLVLCVAAFWLLLSLKKQFTSPEGASSAAPSLSSSTEENALSSVSALSESQSSLSASSSSSSEATGILSGTAQPNANTTTVKQNAGGTGKNHNAAAGVYAYKTEDVNDAMYNGKTIFAEKLAFLTFDDGVDPQSTPLLLDTLKELGVPATFFMVGQSFTAENKPLLERTLAEGHAFALHSFDHDYDKLYPGGTGSATEILDQYHRAKEALQELLGKEVDPKPWRYPGGHMSWNGLDDADAQLKKEGVQWIDWNCLNGDAEGSTSPESTQGQVDRVLQTWEAYGKPSVITILMHDTAAKTLTRESVPAIVKALQEQGFSFGILE
ncbi:polysaccharide deacetylase family protein [uncultured Murdochiella sp.]|uniref:polysaccharide deacetylase family protein n=1 Tax=uncultured Murdochiella sp. TaxID=1586095 RepID=UPI0028055E99|nr:polysaccharide deacetylase family protein [uncultured Murdochiella sp.]